MFRGQNPGVLIGPVRIAASGTRYLKTGVLTRFKSVVAEGVWTGTSAGRNVTIAGGLSTASTDFSTICVVRSTARGQRTSTGTATKLANVLRLTLSGTYTTAKYVDLYVAAVVSS